MSEQPEIAKAKAQPAMSRRDRGATFVEMLVAIVLLGTTVVGVLTAVRATVIGSAVERDHAKAHQWLQSAIGVITSEPFVNCDISGFPDGSNIQDAYKNAVIAKADVPDGWLSTAADIQVLAPKVWNGLTFVDFNAQLSPSPSCYDQNQLRQQLIKIEVRNPSGEIIENVEVVKS